MTELKNYPIKFIERTLLMLNKLENSAKENELEVTFFLNSLFGIIVLLVENIDQCKKDCFNIKLNSRDLKCIIPKKIKVLDCKSLLNDSKSAINEFGFIENLTKSTIELRNFSISFIKRTELMNYELIWLLRKIRNGIAHQHIMPTSESKKWKGIRIWNINKRGIKDFAIEFKIKELKDFSKFITELFLTNLK